MAQTDLCKRNPNWNSDEKTLLWKCLENVLDSIESKSKNTKQRGIAWQKIAYRFNKTNYRKRTLLELKQQWKAMKFNSKKCYLNYKNYNKIFQETGGGEKPPTPDETTLKIVEKLIPEFKKDEFECHSFPQNNGQKENLNESTGNNYVIKVEIEEYDESQDIQNTTNEEDNQAECIPNSSAVKLVKAESGENKVIETNVKQEPKSPNPNKQCYEIKQEKEEREKKACKRAVQEIPPLNVLPGSKRCKLEEDSAIVKRAEAEIERQKEKIEQQLQLDLDIYNRGMQLLNLERQLKLQKLDHQKKMAELTYHMELEKLKYKQKLLELKLNNMLNK